MASSGWQGDVTLTDGGFGYSYFKGNLRIDSITHSGDTVTVTGAFGVHNDGGASSYYVYPINAEVDGSTNYQEVVAGNQWIADGEWVTSAVTFTFNAPAASSSASIQVLWSYNNGQAGNSINYNLSFDPAISPPTGLNVTNISSGSDFVAATVSVTGWGIGSGTRYRELQVWTYDFQNPRKYKYVTGDTMSGSITVNNSSSGSLTILPNSRYTVGAYATNGQADTGSHSFGTVVTVPAEPMIDATIVGKDYVTFGYYFSDQGGYNTMYIDYKIDSGAWTAATTITGSGEKSGNFTVAGLSPSTEYIITPRVRSSDGWTKTMSSITVATAAPQAKLYCSVNDTAKQAKKIYCSVGGVAKRVTKIYGSVNGVAKLVYEEPNI